MKIELHVRILGQLWISYSAIAIFAAVTGVVVGGGELLLVALVSVSGIIGGIGLLKWRAWARVLVLVLGFTNLFILPPVGTVLGAYTIWVLFKRETAQAFHLDRS